MKGRAIWAWGAGRHGRLPAKPGGRRRRNPLWLDWAWVMVTAFALATLAVGCHAGPAEEPAGEDAYNATVVSVTGTVALVEMDIPEGHGPGGRTLAKNPYPGLLPGDRVEVSARMHLDGGNYIARAEDEERAILPADETTGAPR